MNDKRSAVNPCPTIDAWEEQVSQALGELPEELAAHLETCAACRCLYEELRRNQAFLPDVRSAVSRSGGIARLRSSVAVPGELQSSRRSRAVLADPAGPHLPGYRLMQQVACTNLSVVYEAIQESTGQRVAVKVLAGPPALDSGMRARFEREVDLLVTLRHPNIVPIYDAGITGAHYYLIMPFIAGCPPDVHAEQAGFDLSARLGLMRDICDAVEFAHQHGVLHRDLKPSNILVDERGAPHILDFGLGKILHGEGGGFDPGVTLHSGQLLGTPAYMSPEQTSGRPQDLDARSDVYALGVLLYKLLTGAMPYPTDVGLGETLRHIQSTDPVPPRAHRRTLPRDVEAVTLKALAKERDRRYATADELARDLDRLLNGEAVLARRGQASYRLTKSLKRRWKLAGVALLVIVAGSVRQILRKSVPSPPVLSVTLENGIAGPSRSEYLQWVEWKHTGALSPPARDRAAMTFDAARQVVVLFGGVNTQNGRLKDTWTWDGDRWQAAGVEGPSERSETALVYDDREQACVLFGGNAGTRYGDTWRWDGGRWEKLSQEGPVPRSNHAMTYDRARGCVVLFGGLTTNSQGDQQHLDDTWEWDGEQWLQRSPPHRPPARANAAMVYDRSLNRVVLFGGGDGTEELADVWQWDGTDWQRLSADDPDPNAHPPKRAWHAMVYHDAIQRFVLCGGRWAEETAAGKVERIWTGTWVGNGTKWYGALGGPPANRSEHAMAYDAARDEVLLFGGRAGTLDGPTSETWRLVRLTTRCDEILRFEAIPQEGGLRLLIELNNDRHDGQVLTLGLDTDRRPFPIAGSALDQTIAVELGHHRVELLDPPGCDRAVEVDCPAVHSPP